MGKKLTRYAFITGKHWVFEIALAGFPFIAGILGGVHWADITAFQPATGGRSIDRGVTAFWFFAAISVVFYIVKWVAHRESERISADERLAASQKISDLQEQLTAFEGTVSS